jgi:hypothetical protein
MNNKERRMTRWVLLYDGRKTVLNDESLIQINGF